MVCPPVSLFRGVRVAGDCRRAIQSASRECVLMCVRSAGFVLRTVGRAAPAHEAPILVAAPHSSFFDTVAAMHGNPVPSAVVRSKSKGMFFLGSTSSSTPPFQFHVGLVCLSLSLSPWWLGPLVCRLLGAN